MFQLIELFSKLGVNGLLVEYEDMFPYDGDLKLLQATAQPPYRCSLGRELLDAVGFIPDLVAGCICMCSFIVML